MPDAPSPVAGPPPRAVHPADRRPALEDLRARLRATRWPDAPEDTTNRLQRSARWLAAWLTQGGPDVIAEAGRGDVLAVAKVRNA